MLKPNGESAGYGFVHFDSDEAARLAVEKVNGMSLNGKIVFVGFFERRANRLELHKQKFTNIYIKHLKSEVTKEKLDEVFCMPLLCFCVTRFIFEHVPMIMVLHKLFQLRGLGAFPPFFVQVPSL